MKINSSVDSSFFSNLTSSIKNKQEEKTIWNQQNQQKNANALFDFSAIQKSAAQSKKQAAYARMAMLKAQLEAMLKFSSLGGASPKLVAQLARELKSLVAQYGSASGGGGGGGSVVSVPQISVVTNDQTQAASVAEGAEAAAAEAVAAEEVAAVASGVSEAEVQAAVAAASEFEDDPSKQTETEASGVDDAKQNSGTDTQNKNSDLAADRAFFTEAKRLAQLIKLLMEIAKKAENEEEAKDVKRARRDIDEMDETIADVEKETLAAHSSGVAIDGGSADVVVQPTVSVGNVSIYV